MNESFIEYVMNGNIQLKLQRYTYGVPTEMEN